jgi:hypothetical protein
MTPAEGGMVRNIGQAVRFHNPGDRNISDCVNVPSTFIIRFKDGIGHD